MPRSRSVMFESWRGQYNDGPRAVSERLATVRPDLRRYWVSDGSGAFPPDVTPVRRHTPRYFGHLLTTDILVCNDIVSRHVVKGPGTTYVQLWHGTPLKLIGHDERMLAYAGAGDHLRRLDRDVAKWDYLVSPSPECTTMFRSAFGFEGQVWEIGYPRNDVLLSEDAARLRETTRQALGIDDGTLAVLYAPTWRDNDRTSDGRLTLSDHLDAELLHQEARSPLALIYRMHKNVAVSPRFDGSRVIDGNAVADIAHLYLAADVLISDYSSVAYDFAVTGKPIILFAPDLDRYRDETRGFYFDYEDWAPGPIARETAEVAAYLSDPAGLVDEHRDRYQRFVTRFCPLDDGQSTARLCDLLLDASRV